MSCLRPAVGLLLATSLWSADAAAPAPVLDGYTADPAIRVFGDRYYLYPTSDKAEWQCTDFSVWSSPDLKQWKREGMILDVTSQLAWAKGEAWAPDCIERNGTWYFYFCANRQIGVATAASPVGPFRDALGKPLITRKDPGGFPGQAIDPYPFIDEDGQAFLYFGSTNGIMNVVKLKADLVTLDGPVQSLAARDFREGAVVFKRQGRYYFMWSIDDARSPDYRVGWGWSTSPLGPVTSPADHVVLRQHGAAKGTGHHSVVQIPEADRWYCAFHRHAIPNGNGYTRETCLTPMIFAADGSIRPMDPLVPAVAPGADGEPLQGGRGRP